MKKSIFTFCLALTTVLVLNAESYSGNIVVNRNGQVYNSNVTVTVTQQDNGLFQLDLNVPIFGNMKMVDVPAATTGGITVYNSQQKVSTSLDALTGGPLLTQLFARTTGGMMAANVTLPTANATMWFNTVGNTFQLPNSDLEAWSGSNGEPDRWHGFKTATGTWAWAAPASLAKSEDVHSGSAGEYSALITAKNAFGTIANGTMTSGRLNAGSTSASSTSNNASTSQDYGEDFYMPIYAKPDQFKVWLKYQQGTSNANNKANVSVKTFDGTYYQEPVDKTYTNISGGILEDEGQIAACDWTQFTFPINYDYWAANNAETNGIFVTFSTNANPGQGSDNDMLYIDEMELVYLGSMSDLRYKGETLQGWDPAVTEYSIETAGEPNLDDFTATVVGASAVLTKSMEQNADGTYRIVLSVVSADLQNAASYIITATAAQQGKLGDLNHDNSVDVADVTALINAILNSSEVDMSVADMNGDKSIDVADVTALIALILSN
jgi:hypothetical protein